MQLVPQLAGQAVACPHCRAPIQMPGGAPVAMPYSAPPPAAIDPFVYQPAQPGQQFPGQPYAANPYQSGSSSRSYGRKNQTQGQELVNAGLIWGMVGLAVGVALGVLVSQFFPIMGNELAVFGSPFGRLRLSTLPVHCLVLGGMGSIAGSGIAVAIKYSSSSR